MVPTRHFQARDRQIKQFSDRDGSTIFSVIKKMKQFLCDEEDVMRPPEEVREERSALII
jgi:hypothetical protein